MESNRRSKKLTRAQLKLLVAVLLRNEKVFEHFYGKLTVDHFTDESYRLLYRMLLNFYNDDSHDEVLPTSPEVWTELENHFEKDSEIISESGRLDLEEFLEWAYEESTFADCSPNSPKIERFAFGAAKKLLQQKHLEDSLKRMREEDDLDAFPMLFQQCQSQAEVLQLEGHQTERSFVYGEAWDKKRPLIVHTTGIEFLDNFLAGGAASGEAYGLMAPYGTYKTTLGVMLWVEAAKECQSETLLPSWKGKKGMTVFVSYEAPMSPELQHRGMMYRAQVHRSSLQSMGYEGLEALGNDPEKPKPYEKKLFPKLIKSGKFVPERARVEEARPTLNEHLCCLDFSGSDENYPSAGYGGVSEIVSRIKLELRNRQNEGEEWYVKNVIIDYLALMVERDREISSDSEDHKTFQQQVGRIVREISKEFKCHTWILQQLSGQANSMLSPTKLLHHTDSKGSKSFAENLDFCFVGGNLNKDSMGQIGCTKHRRAKKMEPVLIHVEGEFNRLSISQSYHIDAMGNIAEKGNSEAAGEKQNSASSSQFDDLGSNSSEGGNAPEEENSEEGTSAEEEDDFVEEEDDFVEEDEETMSE